MSSEKRCPDCGRTWCPGAKAKGYCTLYTQPSDVGEPVAEAGEGDRRAMERGDIAPITLAHMSERLREISGSSDPWQYHFQIELEDEAERLASMALRMVKRGTNKEVAEELAAIAKLFEEGNDED